MSLEKCSRQAEKWTSVSPRFKVLATLAETFIFIYMGVAMFLESQAWATMPFALVGIVGGARGPGPGCLTDCYPH